jgi:purine-nucleoside phosphorylase
MELEKKIEEAKYFIGKNSSIKPLFGIILGTGFNGLENRIEAKEVFFYDSIPHFPESINKDQRKKMTLGIFGKKEVAVFQNRLHYYEGYTMKEVTFPVRIMKSLGAHVLITFNAAGGLNLKFSPGDIMVISDHINLMGSNPLIGPNEGNLGIRFPDMSEPYSAKLISLAEKIARQEKTPLKKGVYVGLAGPSLETKAETRFLRMMGADAVGMSTVPEVIAAIHANMEVLGFSVITNLNDPDRMEPISIEKIIDVAQRTEHKLIRIIEKIIEETNPEEMINARK